MKKNPVYIGIGAALLAVFIAVFLISLSAPAEPAFSATDDQPLTIPATETTAPEPQTVTLSFIGDCILGSESTSNREGNFTWYSENYPLSYFFEKVYDTLSADDFTIANMECVLSDRELEKTYKDYDPAFWFKAKSKNAMILTEGSVEIASVVNNHVYDYGDEGYSDTVESLTKAGLMVGEDYSPIYFEKNGIRVGLVCANLWAYYQTSYIKTALEDMQNNCDYKIVFFHGGEEGQHEPDNYKIDACRDLAKSGLCDMIVGAHPHVLQPMEVVNNVPIVYSLGNFCFAGNNYPENKTIIFQAELSQKDNGEIVTTTNIIPCYVFTGAYNNWQPAIITDENDKAEIMAMMNTPVDYIKETTSAPTTSAPTEATEYRDNTPTEPEYIYTEASSPEPTEIPTIIYDY